MKFHFTAQFASALACVVLALGTCSASAAAGAPDTSFAGTGFTRIGFGQGSGFGYAAAVQSDGKLVIAGSGGSDLITPSEFAVVRFTTNNILDPSFGAGGKVLSAVGSLTNSGAYAVAVQADGKLVAAGYANTLIGTNTNACFALVRSLPDGRLDGSFGIQGKVLQYLGPAAPVSSIHAIAIQPDGNILVGGAYGLPDIDYHGTNGFVLARFLTNGTLDTSFGTNGIVLNPLGTVEVGAGVNALLLYGGQIYAAGADSASFGGDGNFAVARYSTDGLLDTAFGGTGIVRTYVGYPKSIYTVNAAAHAMAIQSGNHTPQNPDKLVVAGEGDVAPGESGFAVVRYNLNGTVDTTFGNNGVVTNVFGPGSCHGEGVVVQGQLIQPRKITVGGYSYVVGGDYYFGVARLNANGSLDTTFGTNGTGITTLTFSDSTNNIFLAEASSMTVLSGRIALVGSIANMALSGALDMAAAVFNSDGSFYNTITTSGGPAAGGSDLASQARSLILQPDGKLVVSGAALQAQPGNLVVPVTNVFALARCNTDGSLDTGFGFGGKIATILGINDTSADSVQIQPDGKLVAAGGTYNGINSLFALARYTTNGLLDNSFGTTGVVVTAIGSSNSAAHALALQGDGKFVAAGYSVSGGAKRFAVARYTTNGILDPLFGGTGEVTAAVTSGDDEAFAVKIQPDGKIVAAGSCQVGSYSNFALVRFTTNGLVDASFGLFGRVTTEFVAGNSAIPYAMAQQSDGRLIAAGSAAIGASQYIALARYNTDGTLDSTFGNRGLVISQVGPISDYATSLALQADGKILVSAFSQQTNGNQYVILRYAPEGMLDATYGTNGVATVSFDDGDNDNANVVIVDASGRAVAAGSAGQVFGLARLLGDAPPLISLSIRLTSTNSAVVSWTAAIVGWSLQENSSVTDGSWTAPLEPINNDGTNNYIIVSPPSGSRFYRLVSQ